jgi:DNA polymerase V
MLDALSPGVPLPLRPDSSPRRAPAPGDAAHSGFPSPADDYVESRIDLNLELIPRPLSTFFMRVSGDAMRGDGIHDGDLLVIDRSVQARAGMVVVAVWGGAFLLRRLLQRDGAAWLVASDGASPPIRLASPGEAGGLGEAEGELWGVVLHAVHHLLPPRRIRAGLSSGGS